MDIRKLRPSQISFSVAVVDNRFHKNSKHGYCPIGETLDSLCEGEIKISDIPKISVLKRDTEWITINNRRLWIFRQMERLGKCTKIPVLATDEITLPRDCDAFKDASVREDPGGLCYQFPACQKKTPFSSIMWDTFKHMKQNMFPPPNRQMIITIFHYLLIENQGEDGNSSTGITSGYLDIRMGGFNDAQIDKLNMQKKMRTHQWILAHSVSRDILKYGRSIRALTIELLPRSISLPRYFHTVPGGSLRWNANIEIDMLSDISTTETDRVSDISMTEIDRFSDISTTSQQGSLPDDSSNRVEELSAASCLASESSGYLIVTGKANINLDNEQSIDSGKFVSEDIVAICADQHKDNGNLQANLKEITSDIIHGIESILSHETQRQGEFSKQIPDIQVLIETRIKRAFDVYESEIEALKSDIDSLSLKKKEDIHNLGRVANTEIRDLQELQKNQTQVQGQSSDVDAITHISEVWNCPNEDKSNRLLEIRDEQCNCVISLLESQRSAVYNRRRRTDSEETLTEAAVGESDERDVNRRENLHEALDLDFYNELTNNESMATDSAMSDYQLQDNIFPVCWGYYR